MKRLKSLLAACLGFCLLAPLFPQASAAGEQFSDVPADSFAYQDILDLRSRGIVKGTGGNVYGTYDNFKRGDFVLMLARLMGWDTESGTPQASDVPAGHYAAAAIASAEKQEIIDAAGGYAFRPDDFITREEMAVMLVRALGIGPEMAKTLAAASKSNPFTDLSLTQNPDTFGPVSVAYNFGIINGLSSGKPTQFNPTGNATREQTAAMMMRFYRKYNASLAELHGFYAISSYGQKDLIAQLDDFTTGWSRLEYGESGPVLNTGAQGGNDWSIPSGAQEIIQIGTGKTMLMGVFLSTAQKSGEQTQASLLLSEANRAAAISAITDYLKENPAYAGVTIDFEGFVAAEYKEPYTAFLTELDQALSAMSTNGKAYLLYCAVPPPGNYNGYDYRAIGKVVDKLILMAHDYNATTLPEYMQTEIPQTPLAPYAEVYAALEKITDPQTGVEDKSKVLLAISFDTTRWEYTADSFDANAKKSDYASIYKRLQDGSSQYYYNEQYQSPYLYYQDASDGTTNVVWYENSESVQAKCDLARYFGIGGVSLWRLGTIPDYPDNHLDVWQTLLDAANK